MTLPKTGKLNLGQSVRSARFSTPFLGLDGDVEARLKPRHGKCLTKYLSQFHAIHHPLAPMNPSAIQPTGPTRFLRPASRRFHRFTTLCALLFALALTATCFASGPYCAIAYSKSTGRYGHGEGYDSRAAAEYRALAECGTHDARVVGWVRNGYLSLALGRLVGTYGTGYGSDIYTAKARALKNCPSDNAHIVQTVWAGAHR